MFEHHELEILIFRELPEFPESLIWSVGGYVITNQCQNCESLKIRIFGQFSNTVSK